MHIKEFCGSWMDHPFFRSAFVLTDPKDMQAILSCSIKEVWIDTDKGLDVAVGEVAVSKAESEVEVEQALNHVPDAPRQIAPVPVAVEFERATKICLQAKTAVFSMFEEARMGNTVEIGGAKQLVEEISDSVSRNPGALISLARLKTADDYTYMHSVAVCAMMIALAKRLGFDEAQTRSAGLSGLLHDLGKALTPTEVLNKPGKLTDEEFVIIKSHPLEGHQLLVASNKVDPMVMDVVLHHHEKMDGSGYPDRLKGKQISLWSRMGAVCDVYDAITSNRPYRVGWDPAEALKKMGEWTNGHLDREVFHAFVKSIGIYPIGSLVRMDSGRIGVVTEQTPKSLTAPIVKVFFSTKSDMRIVPILLDLSKRHVNDKIQSREDPDQWNFLDLNELWSGLSNFGKP